MQVCSVSSSLISLSVLLVILATAASQTVSSDLKEDEGHASTREICSDSLHVCQPEHVAGKPTDGQREIQHAHAPLAGARGVERRALHVRHLALVERSGMLKHGDERAIPAQDAERDGRRRRLVVRPGIPGDSQPFSASSAESAQRQRRHAFRAADAHGHIVPPVARDKPPHSPCQRQRVALWRE